MYVMQHLMLVGLMLPWCAISTSSMAWQHLDTAAVCVCAAGIGIAALADNSLHDFVSSHHGDRSEVLKDGLWGISRHPNHLGEQLWWWGAALFAVAVGQPWTLIGTAFNSLCMWKVPPLPPLCCPYAVPRVCQWSASVPTYLYSNDTALARHELHVVTFCVAFFG